MKTLLLLLTLVLLLGCKQQIRVNVLSENCEVIEIVDSFIQNLNKKGVSTNLATYFEVASVSVVLDTLYEKEYGIEIRKINGKSVSILTAKTTNGIRLGLAEIEKQIIEK